MTDEQKKEFIDMIQKDARYGMGLKISGSDYEEIFKILLEYQKQQTNLIFNLIRSGREKVFEEFKQG